MSTPRHARHGRRRTAANFYSSALATAEREDLERAAAAEGLDDEVALLRLLLRRELQARPDDLRLVLHGMALLVRAVAARYRLTPADQQALEQRIVDAVRALTESVQEAAGD